MNCLSRLSKAAVALSLMASVSLPASVAHAETMKVSADLTAGAETPPNGSMGTGQLTGTYDPSTKKLTWDVTYTNLSGPATMAHFHAPAPSGKAAGVEIPIQGPVTSPIKGEATLTADQAKNLTDGMTYFNVHTQKNPKGEIRGQLMVAK